MNRELSLRIDVKNVDELKKLTEFVQALRQAGPAAKGSMREAAEATRGLSNQLQDVTKTVSTGFGGLQAEIAKLSASLSTMGKAAASAGDAAGGAAQAQVRAVEDANKRLEAALARIETLEKASGERRVKAVTDAAKAGADAEVDSKKALNARIAALDASFNASSTSDRTRFNRAAIAREFLQRNNDIDAAIARYGKSAIALAQNTEKMKAEAARFGQTLVSTSDSAITALDAANRKQVEKQQQHNEYVHQLQLNSAKKNTQATEAEIKAQAALRQQAVANARKSYESIAALDAMFNDPTRSEKSRYSIAARARDFMESGNTVWAATQRYGQAAVAMARDIDRMVRSAEALKAATAVVGTSATDRASERALRRDSAFLADSTTDRSRYALASKAKEYLAAGGDMQKATEIFGRQAVAFSQDAQRMEAAAKMYGRAAEELKLRSAEMKTAALYGRQAFGQLFETEAHLKKTIYRYAEKDFTELNQLQAHYKQLEVTAAAAERLAMRARRLDAAFDSAGTTDRSRFRIASNARAFLNNGGSFEDAAAEYGRRAASTASNADAMTALANAISTTTRVKQVDAAQTKVSTVVATDHNKVVKDANAAYGALHSTLRGAAGGFGQVWLSWGRPLAQLWAGFAASTGVRESFKQFMAFEQQFAIIGAIAGETNASVERLSASVLKLGTQGSRGPQELAEGLRVLTQAGLNAQSALDVLPTVSKFATVAEMQLPAAAQSLLGIATAFGRSTSDLSGTADVIGKAAAVSQTSVEAMTAAIRQGSTVAEQYGAKIEDVSGILAVLAKRNIEASAAGTAIRNAYNEIYAPTEKAQRALNLLGISAYDAATKQMKPLMQVFEEMKPKLEQLDKESQNKFLQIIFGERGGKVGSAILSDLQAVGKAIEQVTNSAGFVESSALLIENSVENRWKAAMNQLKASAIEAGAGAEESLRAMINNLAQAFASPAFQTGLQVIVAGVADLVSILTKNAGILATVFTVYLGTKTASALAAVASGILATATAKAGLATAAGVAGTALAAEATALERVRYSLAGVQTAQAAVTATTVGLAGAFATTAGAIARFLPYVGLVITAVMGAGAAWDYFKRRKDNAIGGISTEARTLVESTDKALEETRRKNEAMAQTLHWGGYGALAEQDPGYDAFSRVAEELQKERAAKIAEQQEKLNKARLDPRGDIAQHSGIGDPKTYNRKLEEDAKVRIQGIEEYYDKQIKATQDKQKEFGRLSKENREMELGVAKWNADQFRLKTGTQSQEFDPKNPKGSRGGGGGTYLRAQAEASMVGLDFTAVERDAARRRELLQAERQADLVSEEGYADEMVKIAEDQWAREAQIAGNYLAYTLPQLREDALKNAKDAEARKTIEAQYLARARSVVSRVEQNNFANAQQQQLDDIRLRGKNKALDKVEAEARTNDAKRDGTNAVEIAAMRAKMIRDEELRDIKYNMEILPAVQRQVAERRLEITQEFAQKIAEAEKAGNDDLAEMYRKLQGDMTEAALEGVRRRAEAERSFERGMQRGLRSYLDELTDNAKAGESFVTGSLRSMEDVFVSFTSKGKMSFSDLIDSMIADLARLAVRQSITGPLAQSLMGAIGAPSNYLGGLFGQLTGGPTFAEALAQGVIALHYGGEVGRPSGLTKTVPMSVFAGAPRYHGGGMVLGRNEVPIIAEKGERVLTKAQQSNLDAALSSRSAAPEVQVNVINNGTAQQVSNTETKFDGKRMVVNVILEDLSRNGPISRQLKTARV